MEFSLNPVDALGVGEKESSTVFVPAERIGRPPTTSVGFIVVVEGRVLVLESDFDENMDFAFLKPRANLLPSFFPEPAGLSIAKKGAILSVAREYLADGTAGRVRYR